MGADDVRMLPDDRALVLLSGGQDSATCLAWALRRFGYVEAVSFDYGQRHRVALHAAADIARAAGVMQIVVPCADAFAAIACGSALLVDGVPVNAVRDDGLPATFVPGRNAIFLSLAAGLAAPRGITHLVTGICQTDYSGYPDCREAFRLRIEGALQAALDTDALQIHAPLMYLTKAQTVHFALVFDALDLLARTHTCYEGQRPACGVCPACRIRLRGFAEAGVADPIAYVAR
jgi:7-cyano-7-deazaguanine synthase